MLKDCLEIFEAELERTKKRFGDSDRLILDEYILADGDYLVVEKNGEIRQCSVRMDKKTRTVERIPVDDKLYERICFYDYHSRLVSMDKPQDTKKVIHSNSYLAFWVKWDSFDNGKLNEEAIDRYFDILKDPREKYKKSQDRKMYDYIAKKIGEVDQKKLEKNREWIKGHIFGLDELELNRKNYLKIFFAEEPKLYVQEEQRYVMTKIFNKNDYNVEIDGQIYGLSNDNLGLNSKKPYLEKKTRKMTIPYLITPEEAIRQRKFFDYVMNKANAGETDIFFDYDEKKIISKKRDQMVEGDFSGYFLKIQKGKELEIHHQDTIVDYKYFLKKKFLYRNVIGAEDREGKYKEYVNRQGLQEIVNEVFYSKWLTGNYFTPEDEMSIDGELKRILIWSREAVFAWLYKGREVGMDRILHTVAKNVIKESIKNGYMGKVVQQFNLMCSFDEYFGGCNMADRYSEIREKLRDKINCRGEQIIESDEEYFYAVGQLVGYYISLSKAKEKTHSLANPFFNATSNEVLQTRLKQYFMKYNHEIATRSSRFNYMYGMVLGYELEGKIRQEPIIAGYLSNSLFYESSKKEMEET